MSLQELAVSQLCQFISVMMTEGTAGWREHCEFIQAWDAGLDWFVNFTGGDRLDRQFSAYLEWLRRSDFSNLPLPDGYEDSSGTFNPHWKEELGQGLYQ